METLGIINQPSKMDQQVALEYDALTEAIGHLEVQKAAIEITETKDRFVIPMRVSQFCF